MLYPVYVPPTYNAMSRQSVQFVLSVPPYQISVSAPQVRVCYVTGLSLTSSPHHSYYEC